MKHDWVRYADGHPRLMKGHYYECRRCGSFFYGFPFEQLDAQECPQMELSGFEDLVKIKEQSDG